MLYLCLGKINPSLASPIQINKNFAKTESYCLMNKFTPENVGELLNKIKNAEFRNTKMFEVY